MKKLFIAIAALAAMTSCSQDEVMEVAEKQAISFNNGFINNATRAIDPSYGTTGKDLTSFNVWGSVQGANQNSKVSIFANEVVTGTIGNQVWSYTNTQYWIPGASYEFAALVNAPTGEGNIELTNFVPTSVKFSSTDGQTDLMYASASVAGNTVSATYNTPVNFTFNHMLAKAKFSVTNTTNASDNSKNSNYYYKIKSIKILNPKTSGTCALAATPTWTAQAETENVAYEFGNVTNAESKATTPLTTDAIAITDRMQDQTSHRECLLIPYNYKDSEKLKVSLVVELYMENGETDKLISTDTVTPSVAVDIKAGYSYDFKMTVGIGNPIEFTVTSQPTWTTATNVPTLSW